jgi:hypothetical protein
MQYTCPVCEYPDLSEKPVSSYEICPQCGVEFGYEEPELYPHIRKAWLAAGKPCWSTDRQWQAQLETINLDTIGDHLSAMSTPLDYAEFYFDHVDKGESMKAPAEAVAAPLEPTKLTAHQFYQTWATSNDFWRIPVGNNTWLHFAEAYAAAVSKNLQEELDASQLKVRKYKRYFCDKDTCSPLLDSCESETTCCLPCHLDTAEARIVELEKEIAALRRELSAEINAPGRTDF